MMKLHTQGSVPLQELADGIDGQRVAILTVVDAAGRLVGRPVTPQEMDAQGSLWIMVARGGPVFAPGADGETVSLAFSDERRGTYVSICGRATVVDDLSRKRALWSAAYLPRFVNGPEDPQLLLLRLQPLHAQIWKGPSSRVVQLLDLAPPASN